MTATPLKPVPDAEPELPNGWRFETPPPAAQFGRKARDFSALMAHPGQWVLINARANSSNTASQAKKSAAKHHGGRWDARNVRNKMLTDGKRTWRTYLCYLGPDE
jgi:hypothetical protein